MPKDRKTSEARQEERTRNYPNLRPRPERDNRVVVTPERSENWESADQIIRKECSRRSTRLRSVVGVPEETFGGPSEDREVAVSASSSSVVNTELESVGQEETAKSACAAHSQEPTAVERRPTMSDAVSKSLNPEKSSPKSKSSSPATEIVDYTTDYDEMHEVAAAVAAGNTAKETGENEGNQTSQPKADKT